MTDATPTPQWIAFLQDKCIATGAPQAVVTTVKNRTEPQGGDGLLVFDAQSSETIELDLRGSLAEVLARLAPATASPPDPDAPATAEGAAPRAPGRPKLGVTAREVTLLPRHWQWLAAQPGGASTVLRKLVEQAMRNSREADRLRQAQEAAYRFMNVMAGDRAGYEDAIRALFAGDLVRLQQAITGWPADIRVHALELAIQAIAASPGAEVSAAPALPPV